MQVNSEWGPVQEVIVELRGGGHNHRKGLCEPVLSLRHITYICIDICIYYIHINIYIYMCACEYVCINNILVYIYIYIHIGVCLLLQFKQMRMYISCYIMLHTYVCVRMCVQKR